jgi:hypothetical protein
MRVLAIGAIVMTSAIAHAGGTGVVTLAEPARRAAVATALATAMREAKVARAVDDALAEARTAGAAGAVPIETMLRFRRVREQIEEGWRAYHGVQLDFAASRLAAARTEAEALLVLQGAAALYADASLRLGAVLAQLGRQAESHDAIALALALDPDRPISPLEFAPEIIAAIDAVRAQSRPTHGVKLTTEPAGATLSVDGRDAGRSPATVELGVGQHVVVARSLQYQAAARAFAVDASTTELPLALEHDDEAARLSTGVEPGMPDAATQALTESVLRLADLDEVVLAAETERSGGPTLLLQRCAGVPAKCTAVVELGYADRSGIAAAARAAWQSVRAADLRYAPNLFGDARITGNHGGDVCRVCRNPYVLAGVGAALVAGTIVIIAVATASRPPPILGVDPTQYTH